MYAKSVEVVRRGGEVASQEPPKFEAMVNTKAYRFVSIHSSTTL
jgi:hypothetical protein